MRTLLFTFASLASTLSAQDFLLYKFDSPCTNEVINHANGSGAFPANGTLAYNTPTAYQPGMFGGALSGGSAATNTYSRVDSGWSPAAQPMTGSITLAFWAKERTPVGTALNYLCGCTSTGHRLFTNGVGGTGLYFRNIVASGPNTLDLVLPAATTNFQALASAGWVHIALVIDATAGTADWYVNGTSAIHYTGVGPTPPATTSSACSSPPMSATTTSTSGCSATAPTRRPRSWACHWFHAPVTATTPRPRRRNAAAATSRSAAPAAHPTSATSATSSKSPRRRPACSSC
ncbi:MAG: LamG domain-containing protein [Planctomycetes bacterium]|nr:LamG domain-containing protein [Planctomycetota bacterium]